MKLSIIIPVYNEKHSVASLLECVRRVDLKKIKIKKEIIVIDDASTDGSQDILKTIKGIKLLTHKKNLGKGGAIRSGLAIATGDFTIIQDADLEYNPEEYPKLIKPLFDGKADVVYGSRFIGGEPHRALYFWHYIGNKALTTLSNALTNLNLTDMETCYKAFTQQAVNKILPHLTSNRFGIEPEITAQVAKNDLRIMEVGISYHGRTYAEGKKISWKDGLAAIWHIIKYNLLD